MALGSCCFGLLFLGSGSTFGSTSPPLSGGASLPLYPSSFFEQQTQRHLLVPPRYSPGQTKESSRTPVSDRRLLPSRRPPPDQHRDLGPGTASREKTRQPRPFPYWGFGDGVGISNEGDDILGISNGGVRPLADPRGVQPAALAGRWFPSDWEGRHFRNFRRCRAGEQFPISYYNELFVWNQACQRKPVHFHLIGSET